MAMETATRNGQSSPQLLERTFAVLALFTRSQPEWTTTEVARACTLPVPTVHRIMAALHLHEFVERDEITKRFRLGRAAVELGRSARGSTDLRSVSLPIMQRLAVRTAETVVLTVLSDVPGRAVCLERVESNQPLRLSVEPGSHLPLNAGASQKALLAFLPAAERERVTAGPLEKLCTATIDNPQRLREDIAVIRARGWASSFEETNIGVCGVAVALLDDAHHAVAALGVAGPRVRGPRSQLKHWLSALQAAADELASRLALKTSTRFAATARLFRAGVNTPKG